MSRFKLAAGIPAYTNAGGLARLIPQLYAQEGIDLSLYLVCNHPAAEAVCKKWQARGAYAYFPGDNTGVAGAWNHLAAGAFLQGHDKIVLLNDDCEPADPQAFYRMCLADTLWKGRALLTAGPAGWHCFLLPKFLYLGVGAFDTGFWPAYYEDNDYSYRIKLATKDHENITDIINGMPYDPLRELAMALPIAHTGAGAQSNLAVDAFLKKTHPYAHARYLAKWGGPAKQEKFTKAWNGGLPAKGVRELLAKDDLLCP